jgi:cyclophilin family peptidyl-prolyl cis-trans isomerase
VPSDKRVRQQANKHQMDQLRRTQMQRRRRQRFFLFGGVAAVVIALIAVLTAVLSGGGGKTAAGTTTVSSASTTSTTAPTTTTAPPVSVPLVSAPAKVGCPDLNGGSKHYTHFSAAPPMCINPAKTYTASMVTNVGTITIKLLAAENPTTVNNFVFLAGYHFFNGTAFHRVCIAFINQGGDPTGTGTGGPGYSFNGGAPKSSSVYTAGALAMANSGSPSSDGSQFFFVVGTGGKELSPNYSYFGQVSGGLSVVNKINADGTSAAATSDNCPPKVVSKITSVSITES